MNSIGKFLKSLRCSFLNESEDFFLKHIDKSKLPAHVAIIMDGNGRWAKKRGFSRIVGHKVGTETVRKVVKIAAELGVRYLTLYAFSVENWQRPKGEISALMDLFEEMLNKEIDELNKNDVRIMFIGSLSELSHGLQASINNASKRTAKNTGLTLTIGINYGGRTEIVDCMKQIAREIEEKRLSSREIDEKIITKNLYMSGIPDPDLLIRTSGEYRVSNFLLWEIAYSEIWITSVLWPDFKRKDFLKAIYDFQRRKRRFGGLEED
ncbi:MAG TPA: isoprenyl transferase [Actinobacteria bacterium]|nr:isoprenyl transferase [Actinomycetota bacterium]